MELGALVSVILVSTQKAQAFKAQVREPMISTAKHKLAFGGLQKHDPGVPLLLVRRQREQRL